MNSDKRIFPDFKILNDYYFKNSDETIESFNRHGVLVESQHFNEEFYWHVAEQFGTICKAYNIYGHYHELLYLILYYNESLVSYIDKIYDDCEDDKIIKEVANFLLAFRRNEESGKIQIAIKDNLGTHKITNNEVANWMVDLINKEIEAGRTPFDRFGEKMFSDFFGAKLALGSKIDISRLEVASQIKLKSPEVLIERLLVRFYNYLKPYLDQYTKLATPDNYALTNIQANFFFDLFTLLGHIKPIKTSLTNAKRMRTILKNNQAFDNAK